MGIPRLTAHLKPYFESTDLGCEKRCSSSKDISLQHTVTIDGPGLVYNVYGKLISESGAASALDAMPPYNLIGQAVVEYLTWLKSNNIEIRSIFFDGYLPQSKTTTRIERLEQQLRQVTTFLVNHPTGARVKPETYKSTKSTKADSGKSTAPYHRQWLPAMPFIVPAAMEAILATEYSSLVKLVPGEADVFCAFDAFSVGSTALTGDSDLLVYDLAKGRVAFFQDLSHGTCNQCQSSSIKAEIFSSKSVAERLRVTSILDVAYSIKTDNTTTLAEAVSRARGLARNKTGIDKKWQSDDYEDFVSDYNLEQQISDSEKLRFKAGIAWTTTRLDPRVSEFILQCLESEEYASASMYLPFLLDDPRRTSAWGVLSTTREIAYSISTVSRSSIKVMEVHRRGPDIRPQQVGLLDEAQIQEYAKNLSESLGTVFDAFEGESTAVQWRLFTIFSIICWHHQTDRQVPPDRELSRALHNCGENEWLSWSEIHLSAMVDACLFSLRLLRQILEYFDPQEMSLQALGTKLSMLPSLAELHPPRSRRTKYALDFTKLRSTAEVHVGLGRSTAQDSSHDAISVRPKAPKQGPRKKRKKDRKRKTDQAGLDTVTEPNTKDKNNMYSILAEV